MNDSLMQGAWPEAAPAPLESTDDASLFLLQHAGQHVHARGCRRAAGGALATLAERVAAFFAQQRGGPGLLVGAVPFEPRADDALYQPERLLPALPLQPQAAPALDRRCRPSPQRRTMQLRLPRQ
jgi:isochorismate synthase